MDDPIGDRAGAGPEEKDKTDEGEDKRLKRATKEAGGAGSIATQVDVNKKEEENEGAPEPKPDQKKPEEDDDQKGDNKWTQVHQDVDMRDVGQEEEGETKTDENQKNGKPRTEDQKEGEESSSRMGGTTSQLNWIQGTIAHESREMDDENEEEVPVESITQDGESEGEEDDEEAPVVSMARDGDSEKESEEEDPIEDTELDEGQKQASERIMEPKAKKCRQAKSAGIRWRTVMAYTGNKVADMVMSFGANIFAARTYFAWMEEKSGPLDTTTMAAINAMLSVNATFCPISSNSVSSAASGTYHTYPTNFYLTACATPTTYLYIGNPVKSAPVAPASCPTVCTVSTTSLPDWHILDTGCAPPP